MFHVDVCQDWIVLLSQQTMTPNPALCMPFIYIYICMSICWAIYGNGLSAPASFLDEESFFRLEAISVSRGPGNGQVVLWVCAVSEGHSINEFEEDCGSGTLPVIPFKV